MADSSPVFLKEILQDMRERILRIEAATQGLPALEVRVSSLERHRDWRKTILGTVIAGCGVAVLTYLLRR